MIDALHNAMRLQALRALDRTVGSRLGTVTSYDPNRYAAKVTLQPDDLQTGWLPVAAIWVGPDWGLFSPPSPGDLVKVEFVDGDVGAGTVTGRYWTTDAPPLSVPSGEWWLIHAKGQFIKLTNDGKLTLSDGQGATITLDGSGNVNSQAKQWNHTGPVHFSDNVQVDKTLTANTDVIGGGKSLKNHTHGNVQNGGGSTSPPL
jgi:phage baseplate assembly protein V